MKFLLRLPRPSRRSCRSRLAAYDGRGILAFMQSRTFQSAVMILTGLASSEYRLGCGVYRSVSALETGHAAPGAARPAPGADTQPQIRNRHSVGLAEFLERRGISMKVTPPMSIRLGTSSSASPRPEVPRQRFSGAAVSTAGSNA